MQSLKGKLLIASSRLMDPNFLQTVILLLQHDENGAMGVILNRALSITVKQACEPVLDLECAIDAPLHAGGPCEGPLMALHTYREAAENEIVPGVFFAMEREKMEELLRESPTPVKFIANYSGWGAGQLEAEIEEGSWLVVDASKSSIFADHDNLWSKLTSHVTLGQWVRPDLVPDDASLN